MKKEKEEIIKRLKNINYQNFIINPALKIISINIRSIKNNKKNIYAL